MAQASQGHPLLIAALPVLAITQAVAGSLSLFVDIGVSIAARSAANDTAAVPATYAFTIWGVIFLWSLAFAIYQALPGQRDNPFFERLRAPAATTWAINTIWEVNAQANGLGWSSTIIIIALVGAALWAVLRFRTYSGTITARDRWIAAGPLLAIAGWGTVAAFGQISTTADIVGDYGLGLPPELRDAVLVFCSGLLGWGVVRSTPQSGPYAAAVVWGLIAVAIKGLHWDVFGIVVAAIGGAAGVLIAYLRHHRTGAERIVR